MMRNVGLLAPIIAALVTSAPVAPRLTGEAVTGRTILITAHDFAYTGIPARVPAGWLTIRMANAGHELHMLATFSVPHGYTASTLLDSLIRGHAPTNLEEWGGPNSVAPGDTNTVSEFLPAGHYLVGCFVVSPDGKEHLDKGMAGSFEVVAAPDAGSPPASDGRIVLSTYHIGIVGASPRIGVHTLLVRNAAKERHDFVILKVLPGHSVADALAWFTQPTTGKAAAVPIAGTTSLHPGEQAYVKARFTPGTYVLVCWLTTGQKYHYQLGMKTVFTIAAATT